jgi:rSAM/selenodomain-associated transferase 1
MTVGIAVMAKAPCAGRSKTRLVPMISAEQAAHLSAAFLRDLTANLATAAAGGTIVPYVGYAPPGAEAAFDGMLPSGTSLLLADGSVDAPAGVEGFGRCLLHAIQSMLDRGHSAACVLIADSPTLPTRLLLAAAARLESPGDRVVMGPAEDGGYFLLGMKRAHASMFARIDWSTDRVASQTRDRAAEAGVEMDELQSWYDVDEPDTLFRLLRDLAGGYSPDAYPASHTAACLAGFGLHDAQGLSGVAA